MTVLCFLIGGCGTSSPSGGAPLGQSSDVRYLGPLEHSMMLLGVGLGPPGDTAPALSWMAAYRACRPDKCGDADSTKTVTLAQASDSNAGTQNADGSIKPILHNTLAYFVTSIGAKCVPAGGTVGGPEPSPTACTNLSLISAATGSLVYAISGPPSGT